MILLFWGMPVILAAIGIGAAIGGLAGLLTYTGKALWTREAWSWKDALAATAGGLVGGAAFPLVMTGLSALGLPVLASYILAGGLAWGGIWSLAQDATSLALGRTEKLGSWKKYAIATAIGFALTAALTPLAARTLLPGLRPALRPMTTESFVSMSQPVLPNTIKAEAEFLIYGAASEGVTAGVNGLVRSGARVAMGGSIAGARSATEKGAGAADEALRGASAGPEVSLAVAESSSSEAGAAEVPGAVSRWVPASGPDSSESTAELGRESESRGLRGALEELGTERSPQK